ncbi:hypothetical protein CAC42_3219 [Sphaceloma murrayae]|uniref:Uncharacterized protein n=1 Tax=Sphaceloma murrayae TaxID=2082308 RepID=A0A2K1QRX3_9PEZI|nr:hypothetical protein CAC42_3219 [Sphaceloma murrayae]
MSEESILRPRPRRPFSLTSTPDTARSSRPASPATRDQPTSPSLTTGGYDDATPPPSRTRSILNLTSSTLFGIYSPTGYPEKDDPQHPLGAETPLGGRSRAPSLPDGAGLGIDAATWDDRTRRRRSSMLDTSAKRTRLRQQLRRQNSYAKKKGLRAYWIPVAGKTATLGVMGVLYGILIGHLHDRQAIAPIRVEGITRDSWEYLTFWGVAAVALGALMPFVDRLWEGEEVEREDEVEGKEKRIRKVRRGGWAPEWNDVVRSIGAFVGIAFAIRRLPWQSTMQLSLTLALSNPAIWYLLDRTSPGLIFSSTVALSGTALCLAVNPNLIPSPAGLGSVRPGNLASNASTLGGTQPHGGLVAGILSQESIAVATWIASVLFVSCVCFGNIGRRL